MPPDEGVGAPYSTGRVAACTVAQNVSIHAMVSETDPSVEYPTNTGQNPMDLDEPVLLKDKVTIPAFASQIVHIQTQKMFMKGHCLNVMIQPPYPEDKAVGLCIQRVHKELKDGSQNVPQCYETALANLCTSLVDSWSDV